MLKLLVLIGGVLCMGTPLKLAAQDTAVYKDDDAFRKQVYTQVRQDMDKGGIKGFHQLWSESDQVKASQKVKVHYRQLAKPKELPAHAIWKVMNKSVFIIWKYYKKTESNIEGISVHATAFAISADGVMVTNHHVISNVIDRSSHFYAMDSTLFLTDADGNVFGIDSILTYNENADIALFTVKNIHHVPVIPLPLGKEPSAGTPAYILSHPEGFPYYFSSGIVARTSLYNEFGSYTERLNVTADYAKGSSGAPVADEYGTLIGVVSSTHSIYAQNMDNLQMVVKQVVPIRSLRAFLQ